MHKKQPFLSPFLSQTGDIGKAGTWGQGGGSVLEAGYLHYLLGGPGP